MLTVNEIEGRSLTPLSGLLTAADVPGDLVDLDGDLGALLDQAFFTDAAVQPVENGYLGGIVLVLDHEVALAPFGDAATLVLAPAGDLTVCAVELSLETRAGGFAVSLSLLDVAVVLRVDETILRPLLPGSAEPDPDVATIDVALGTATLRFATEQPVEVEFGGTPALPRCMIGETGVIISAGGLRWLTPGSEELPAGTPADFTGLYLEDVTTELASVESADGAVLRLDYAFLGRGGVTAAAALEQLGLDGSLTGFGFTLQTLGITLVQNGLTGCAIGGTLQVPFFDQPVDVALSLSGDGGVQVSLAQAGPEALVDLTVPGLGTFELAGLGLSIDDAGASLLLSGVLQLTVGSPGLQWPAVTIQELGIGSDGNITIAGAWLDLQEPLALNLYGFGMELTRVGFGSEPDGRRWFGVDGAIRLTELLPAGASARGLRVIWDPARPGALPALALEGIGVFFGIPDAFGFEGEVALAEDPATGAKLFTGAMSLGLDALDIGIDAGVTIGRDATTTYVFVHLGVDVPIPIAATGTALYGLEGLFGMNMSPLVTNADVVVDASTTVDRGDWYGWYKHVPDPFSVTDPFKWSADKGAWAFGVGLSLGTLPDAGYSVNAKALLVVLLPGPVILLQGTADLFKPPAGLGGGSAEEGTLSVLAALDGRAGTLQLGIDAAWSAPKVIDISAGIEAFFDFDRLDAWHLWLGRDEPESMRIRAEILSLFHADAWLMLDARGVGTGLGVSFGDSWRFGPVRLTLSAWIAATASLSVRPAQLEGGLDLGGETAIAVGPFGIGLSVGAGLHGASFAPYLVSGTLSVTVALPAPLKDLDVDIELEWSQPETPVIEDPWTAALVEHERCTESWSPTAGGGTADDPDDAAPVVPLDARVLLTFAKPMGDDTPVADNPPGSPPTTAIGDHDAAYALAGLRLHRRRRSHPDEDWQDVTGSVFATWTPDAGAAGSRLQLFARSPFAFTRSTSRRWTDSFLDGLPSWPCAPQPPSGLTCIDWSDYKVGDGLPQLWVQEGATLSSEADLRIRTLGERRAIALRWGTAPDGTPQPGLLWIGLPEPAAVVTMTVEVPIGDWVVLRGWTGGEQVAVDWGLPGTITLRVAATGIDAVTLGWGFNVEPALVSVCWVPQTIADGQDSWNSGHELLEASAERWSSDEPILEPDSHYLLEVTTRALLTKNGNEVERIEELHVAQFQTGGPPGIVPGWLPGPQADGADRFPHGGVLRDTAPYVQWSIPSPGAVPAFRAYDLGCEFDATHVQQMYGADLRIGVHDHDGHPALDQAGNELVFANAWEEAPTTTLTTSTASWLSRLDGCTGAVEWLGLAGDDHVRAALPGLLYDDFSGTLETVWTPHVLDQAETRAANWHLENGVLLQDVDVAGGDRAAVSPDKPGTAYICVDVDVADLAVETLAWAANGAFGLVFRWQGTGDYYRFSVGAQRLRLTRVRGGIARDLWSSPGSYEPGAATRLAVQAEGARIRCQMDERLVCDVVEDDPGGAASGGVGLYTWSSDSAAFDELRARAWPGTALAPECLYTAELQATRPLFTDAFDDLAAFEQVVLSTGGAATTSSASGGTATIARPRRDSLPVAALAGDGDATDYGVECTARPDGSGTFGLVARHTGPDAYLALQLTTGGVRSLVEHNPGSGRTGLIRVLWHDDGEVDAGTTYALGLRCEGTSVTATIDGVEFTATTSLVDGRFGMLSGIAAPGCAFTDLIVRSAPRTATHSWSFTTSRHLGLPDLLDTFAGQSWPQPSEALDRADLSDQAAAGATRLTAARDAVDAARAALTAAVTSGDAVELPQLAEAARTAVSHAHAESGDVHDLLTTALGTPWRPTPPIVELSTVTRGGVLALLLDLPEPLPWERLTWSLTPPGMADDEPLADLVLAWSDDGTRAVLVRPGAHAFGAGTWTLQLALRLDVGAERPAWRRAGSSLTEVGRLRFDL
ncbi:hypothetical protein [Actinomadura sp. 6N118]|uniref:hypothetical protein n=1 Tax=Actinomadura sp. 6N118 TaxID=3375151 RepID=UPI00378EBBC4